MGNKFVEVETQPIIVWCVSSTGGVQNSKLVFENLERGLDFAVQARYRFATGTLAEKRDILATIGSNMILEDKKLRLDAQKPYCYLSEILKVEPSASAEFEPKKRANNTAHLESLWAQNPAMQGWRESNPQ